MKRFKKLLRLLGLIILIVLASVGIGLSGGPPIPPPQRKEDTIEVKVELPKEEDNSKLVLLDIKK